MGLNCRISKEISRINWSHNIRSNKNEINALEPVYMQTFDQRVAVLELDFITDLSLNSHDTQNDEL